MTHLAPQLQLEFPQFWSTVVLVTYRDRLEQWTEQECDYLTEIMSSPAVIGSVVVVG
jgi:hypothetical protein